VVLTVNGVLKVIIIMENFISYSIASDVPTWSMLEYHLVQYE